MRLGRRNLDFLLDFMEVGRRLRVYPSHSFTRELEVQHMQQKSIRDDWGGYTSFDGGVLCFEYVVPARLCKDDSTLPLPVLVALFDEVSSWASMGSDAHLRPGR